MRLPKGTKPEEFIPDPHRRPFTVLHVPTDQPYSIGEDDYHELFPGVVSPVAVTFAPSQEATEETPDGETETEETPENLSALSDEALIAEAKELGMDIPEGVTPQRDLLQATVEDLKASKKVRKNASNG